MIVVLLWAILVIVGVIAKGISDGFSDFIFKILVDVVMTPFTIVIGFYFLTHAVRAYSNGKK
jgi:hypothetical protein